MFSLGCFEGHRALPAPLGALFEAINMALYPPSCSLKTLLEAVTWHCTLLEITTIVCGVGNTTARVSNMTESAQPHISTSVGKSPFFYTH